MCPFPWVKLPQILPNNAGWPHRSCRGLNIKRYMIFIFSPFQFKFLGVFSLSLGAKWRTDSIRSDVKAPIQSNNLIKVRGWKSRSYNRKPRPVEEYSEKKNFLWKKFFLRILCEAKASWHENSPAGAFKFKLFLIVFIIIWKASLKFVQYSQPQARPALGSRILTKGRYMRA